MRIKDKHPTSNALLGTAALFLLPGVLYWWLHGPQWDVADWLRIGGCAFLVAMAVWARWQPLPPAIISVVAYVPLVGLQLLCGLPSILIARILAAAILLLLLIALVAAIRNRAIR